MRWLKQRTKKIVAAAAAGLLLTGAALAGCAAVDDRESEEQHATQEQGEHSGSEGSQGSEASGEHSGEGDEARGEHSGEGNGEHGVGGEGSGEGREGSRELNEAEMSSPIVPLNQPWTGNLGGLAVDAWFDETNQTIHTTVQNRSDQTLCYVQSEPHMKSGTRTVGELGPDKLGDLAPGQEATSVLAISSEPAMAGVLFDGYVTHLEVFDCAGPGPIPHNGGEGGEGSGGEGGSGHAGGEAAERGGEASSAAALSPDETYDETRNGARLILSYDAAANAFVGTVENTTSQVLTRARVEIHLSNGTELGPTTPTDLAPGQVLQVRLASTTAPFTSWTTHAEIGSGEGGGEHGSGEHGSGNGEHGSGGEGSGG